MTEAVIRCTDDLLELFRATKERLMLSNEFVDSIVGLTTGHTDKVLGPTRAKRLSPMTFDAFMEVFALEMVVRVNPDAIARMEARWELRSKDRVRLEPDKLSKRIMKRAETIIVRENGRKGGLTWANKQSALLVEQRRQGGKARMRQLTRKERRELTRKAGLASAAKRRENRSTA